MPGGQLHRRSSPEDSQQAWHLSVAPHIAQRWHHLTHNTDMDLKHAPLPPHKPLPIPPAPLQASGHAAGLAGISVHLTVLTAATLVLLQHWLASIQDALEPADDVLAGPAVHGQIPVL